MLMWWKSAVNLRLFLSLATFRMRSNACDTLTRLCARHVLCWSTFPLVSALGSPGSAAVCTALFAGFAATMTESDFSCPYIIGHGSSPSRCGPPDLGHITRRRRPDSRPLRYLIFRGSIPHPTQSLCTLRNHCRQWSRNTRYQADATPYLGRAYTGRIAPALPGALIRSPLRRGRAGLAERLGRVLRRLQIDHQLEFTGVLYWQVSWIRTFENAVYIRCSSLVQGLDGKVSRPSG